MFGHFLNNIKHLEIKRSNINGKAIFEHEIKRRF